MRFIGVFIFDELLPDRELDRDALDILGLRSGKLDTPMTENFWWYDPKLLTFNSERESCRHVPSNMSQMYRPERHACMNSIQRERKREY